MKIHIFYNGRDFFAPKDNRWPHFGNSTSPRMFLQCAASWELNGWEVSRITTTESGGFEFKNLLRPATREYSLYYWNLWHVLARITEAAWVCNMDIFNVRFTPAHARGVEASSPPLTLDMYALSLHVNGWCASIMRVTPEIAQTAINVINAYDAGLYPIIETDMMCDDVILRKHLPYRNEPYCDFAYIKEGWKEKHLLHFPRSTITRCLDQFPVVT